jgi:hypothetical protein
MNDMDFAVERINFYVNKMGIEMPLELHFEKETYHDFVIRQGDHDYAEKVINDVLYGSDWRNGKATFINVEKHEGDKHEIEDTVVHELIHTKYPNLKHGGQFYHYIKEIRKGNYNPTYGRLNRLRDWIIGN